MKAHIPFYLLLSLLVGCSTYKRWDFSGDVRLDSEDHFALIESVRIPDGEAVERHIHYDNEKLKATGIRFTYWSKSEEENKYSDFRAFYSKGNEEKIEMEVPYQVQNGPSGLPENRIIAYLVPVGATEKLIRDYGGAPLSTPIQEGVYNVFVSFLENGKERNLEFTGDYRFRVSYHEPDFSAWD